jgi:GntR family transcriptional regulator
MELNRNSLLPLYYQLKEILKEELDIGKYKPGDRIPSENELSKWLGISRNTSKQAIADLVSEGHLYRIQGKGTYVSEKQVFKAHAESFSFSAEFKSDNAKLITRVIFAEEILESQETIKFLKLKESTKLFRIQRLRLLNNIPVALQTSYIPQYFCADLLSYDLSHSSLIDILHENPNVSFEYFTENLACGKADKYEAELLKIKRGDPIFFLTRKTFTKKDEIIEVARTFMPGERCEFYFKHGEQVRIDLK